MEIIGEKINGTRQSVAQAIAERDADFIRDLARRQGLFSAPEKLSGSCGRLLCCLRYELNVYEDAQKLFPSVGSRVVTRRGVGEVIEVNLLKSNFKLRYDDSNEEVLEVHDEENEWELLREHK